MIEVFKTNVRDIRQAEELIIKIENLSTSYQVNFDLADCDRILRVFSNRGTIEVERIIRISAELGFKVEVLE